MNITDRKVLHKGYINLLEFTINNDYKRVLYTKTDNKGRIRDEVVAGLVFNTNANKIYLVRQERPALYDMENKDIIEVVAGNLEIGENPSECFIREVKEELNIELEKEKDFLISVGSFYTSPGRMGELCHLFMVMTEKEPTSLTSGLVEENEHINIIEVPIDEIDNIEIKDMKTMFLLSAFTNMIV